MSAGASGPQPQDDYAFTHQFEGMCDIFSHTFYVIDRARLTIAEVDRAYENLQKSGKGYGMGGRRKFRANVPLGPARFPPRSW